MQHERVSDLLAEVERLVREDSLPAPAKREVAVSVADEITSPAVSLVAADEEEDDDEVSAVAGDALGLISNFFATGPGTKAFLTRVAPTSFYLAGALGWERAAQEVVSGAWSL